MNKTLIIIPSRLGASRLPGKPLLKIRGISLISHVFKRAEEANIGEVFVAAEDQEIIDDVKKNGGQAILTSKKHKTGTDRIFELFTKIGREDVDLVMNLQGDEPLINIEDIKNLNSHMINKKAKIGTLASTISDKKILNNQNVVKVLTNEILTFSKFISAVDFLRNLEFSNLVNKNVYHHHGVYCYKLEVLKKFVSLSQTPKEKIYKLEQLRALDNDIKIKVALAKSFSMGVDTKEDYLAIKKIMEYK